MTSRKRATRRREKKGEEGFIARFNHKLTENLQEQIRNSPLWDQMVEEFGQKKAKELLKQCRGNLSEQ